MWTTIWALLPHLMLLLGLLLGFAVLVQLVRQRRTPHATLAWTLSIILVPYVGIPLYLLIGGRKLRRMMQQKQVIELGVHDTAAPEPVHATDALLRSYHLPGATTTNALRLHSDGPAAFAGLTSVIDAAQQNLDVTMFILRKDATGQAIVERLAQRCREGVTVRLLLDYLGSREALRGMLNPFREAGGQVGLFMPISRLGLRRRIDLRSHRKLVLADGVRCWTGGMNLGREYLSPEPHAKQWRDLAYTVAGPAARLLWEVFQRDWEFACNDQIAETPPAKPTGDAVVQVVPSGPDVDGDPLYDSILINMHTARARIWVVTPYFIPDEILNAGLRLAVRRGVDVRIIMPARSNHPITDLVRGPYLRELAAEGAQICLYPDGMLHAKGVLFDDLALLGSMNLDARSLFLNYEIATYIYSPPDVQHVEAWMQNLISRCRQSDHRVGPVRDFIEGVVRMAAPLL